MAFKIEFDNNNMPIAPSFLLTKRNGDTLGIINNVNGIDINVDTDVPTVSFTVYKDDNGTRCAVWDELTDLRLVYCMEFDKWFEITVSLSDGTEVVKSVSGTQIEQAELSQINLYGIEINTEDDIAREDYVEPSVIYNPQKPEASVLNRILRDKAPHYTILHVDESLMNIQRVFSFDDTPLKDAIDEICEEINAVPVYGEKRTDDRVPQRTISLYDLSYICRDCGYRGEIFDTCPKCGSTNIWKGYGEDTTIFVTKDNLTDQVDYSVNTDEVKNCFRLEAGDDLMTATVANVNPNGSQYIWYFSDEMKADMPSALSSKLEAYDGTVTEYTNTKTFDVTASKVTAYNQLVTKYSYGTDDEKKIDSPIVGFTNLTTALYEIIDFRLYLKDSMIPTRQIEDTTAAEEVLKLSATNLSPISVANYSAASQSTVENYVKSIAKIFVDYRYNVELQDSVFDSVNHLWIGRFVVTNYHDEEDTATGNIIPISITDDYTNYMAQKIANVIKKKEVEEYDIASVLAKSVTQVSDTVFTGDLPTELHRYSLNALKGIHNCCQSVIDVLTQESIGDDTTLSDLYDTFYEPYYIKLKCIEAQISERETDLATVEQLYTEVNGSRKSAQDALNLQAFLGEELWDTFCSYRREDKYSNDNYISDGLTNTQLMENAAEFIRVASRDIVKSATSQHSISSTLKNLLTIKEFEKLVDYFDIWNWIRIEVDGEIYKLRLVGFNISFDSLENIDVEFSDVIKGGTIVSDSKSLYGKMSSMASTYTAVTRQSETGVKAQLQVEDWKGNGLYASVTPIISGENNTITQDSHGMLFREYIDQYDVYSPTQLRILNSTLAITDNNWQSTKAAIGLFKYRDPETNTIKSAYGVNGETVIGKLLLGEELGIYNPEATLKFNQNGLVVTNNVNTITINPNATSLFTVSNRRENVISFDTSGNGVFNGTLYAESGEVGGYHITHYNLYTQFSTQSKQWVKRQAVDENGDPIFETELAYDAQGNPIYQTDSQGNIIYNIEIARDENGGVIYETDSEGNIIYQTVQVYDADGYPMYDDNGNPVTRQEPVQKTIQVPIQATVQVPVMIDVEITVDNYYNNYTVLNSTGNVAVAVGATGTTTDASGATVPNAYTAPIRLYNNGDIVTGAHYITVGRGEPNFFMQRTRANGNVTTANIYSWDSDSPGFSFRFRPSESASYTYSTVIDKDGVFPYYNNAGYIGSSSKRWNFVCATNLDIAQNGVARMPSMIAMRGTQGRLLNVIRMYDVPGAATSNLVIGSDGNTFIGSGESPYTLYTGVYNNSQAENLFLTSDNYIYFFTNCQAIGNRRYVTLDTNLSFYPNVNATGNLGAGSYRWNNIFSAHAVSVSSDEKIKKDLLPIYKGKELIMKIIPYQFRFTTEGSDRIHYGFSAQQFKRAMTEVGIDDCGAFTLDLTAEAKRQGYTRETAPEEEKIYGLRYEEIIAPMVQAIQDLNERVQQLEQMIHEG